MAKDDELVSKAVELLEEAIEKAERLKVSKRSQGSARELLIKLRKARNLVITELAQPKPRFDWLGAVLAKAAEWLGKLLINNIQYLFSPKGHEVTKAWELDLHSSTTDCVLVSNRRTSHAAWAPLRPTCRWLSLMPVA